MKKSDSIEEDIRTVYEKGELRSISPSKALLKKYRDSARATFIKDRRVNIRLSS
ncbi:MAG: hypothetical protein ACREUD_04055 [Gammaproteobacteria bacterium]